MSGQPRVIKVLTALLASMTIGAVILMVMGNNPPSAGAFCLSSFYSLNPVENAIRSQAVVSSVRWNAIDVYYSRTKSGNISYLTKIHNLSSPEELNCHFVICNGLGGSNGEIQTTERWKKQWSCLPDETWYGSGQTIRICIITDGKTIKPTDFQVKRIESLMVSLQRKFTIRPESIYYPNS